MLQKENRLPPWEPGPWKNRLLFSVAKLLSFLHMDFIRKKHSIGDICFLITMVAVMLKKYSLKTLFFSC